MGFLHVPLHPELWGRGWRVGADRHQPQGQVSPGQGVGKDAHPPSPQQATQGSLLGSGPSIPPTMWPPLTHTAPPPRIPPREHVLVRSPTRSSRHAGCSFTSTSYECIRLACNSGFGRNSLPCAHLCWGAGHPQAPTAPPQEKRLRRHHFHKVTQPCHPPQGWRLACHLLEGIWTQDTQGQEHEGDPRKQLMGTRPQTRLGRALFLLPGHSFLV